MATRTAETWGMSSPRANETETTPADVQLATVAFVAEGLRHAFHEAREAETDEPRRTWYTPNGTPLTVARCEDATALIVNGGDAVLDSDGALQLCLELLRDVVTRGDTSFRVRAAFDLLVNDRDCGF